jgi:hypothetical protein
MNIGLSCRVLSNQSVLKYWSANTFLHLCTRSRDFKPTYVTVCYPRGGLDGRQPCKRTLKVEQKMSLFGQEKARPRGGEGQGQDA